MHLIDLQIIAAELDQRFPFNPDPGWTAMDEVLWKAMQKERFESEVDRRLRSLPLKQYLKEKKRLKLP